MDIFSVAKRSELMRSIKGKNTQPEILIRRLLHRSGFRFRLHDKKLPGTPDIVLKKYKTVILINGCFWHGHTSCKRGVSLPKTRTDFWKAKIEKNRERDKSNIEKLQQLGWKVLTVYECELKTKNLTKTIETLIKNCRSDIC